MDGFSEQFGDVAARVVDHRALLHRLAAVHAIALHQRAAGGVHFDFQRHAKFLAVSEHSDVLRGQASGTGVEIVALVESTVLSGAVGHFDAGAVTNGPIASAGAAASFENDAGVTGLGKLPRRYQPGDSRAEDHHGLAGSRSRRQLQAAGLGGRNWQ